MFYALFILVVKTTEDRIGSLCFELDHESATFASKTALFGSDQNLKRATNVFLSLPFFWKI